MFGATAKIENHMQRVVEAEKKSRFKNFGHASARIRKDAYSSIEKSEEPAAEGQPPHTRRGHLRRALRYDVNKDIAVIGPRASVVGEAGAAHEFGGEFRGEEFPERSFMEPALTRNLDRFAGEWKGSIGA